MNNKLKPITTKKLRIAAIADLHIHESDRGKWSHLFKTISTKADVLVICGDLTYSGSLAEAEVLLEEINSCTIPITGVLGNHDYDMDQQEQIKQLFLSKNIHILDGEAIVIKNIGFIGVKGFGGGFDNTRLAKYGERTIKQFVQEAVDETLRLDAALSRLETDNKGLKKVVLLHYAPIKETIMGENEEIFPFLGCSRLAEPLNNRNVSVVFHGHAHAGKLEGKTSLGTKVFNVSMPVLQKAGYKPPFYIYEI